MNKFINSSQWPIYSSLIQKAVKNVIRSGKVNYWTGGNGKNFEKLFAKIHHRKFALAVSNGTMALDIAIKSLGLRENDEIITTPRSYYASAISIINNRIKIKFCDIEINSHNLDPASVENNITKKTKAILLVHLGGVPSNMNSFMKIKNKYNLKIIEDCSQAHGAKYNNKLVGSFGDLSIWSFCNDKIMTTGGEGGMIATNNKKYFNKINSYKDHGKNFYSISQGKKNNFMWVHDSIGSNFRMTEIQATLGRIQLKKMNDWTTKRFANAMRIWEYARKIQGLIVPNVPNHIGHAAYKCYIFLDLEKISYDRQKIVEEINANGVPCYSGSCPEIYLEKAFSNIRKSEKRHKNAILLGNSSLMFLVHPTLEDRHIQRTCDVLKTVMSKVSN